MRQIETEHRQVMEYDHNGQLIHVVTGYDIRTDGWPFHVYAGPRRDQLRKVGGVGEASSMNEAFDLGYQAGRLFLDSVSP